MWWGLEDFKRIFRFYRENDLKSLLWLYERRFHDWIGTLFSGFILLLLRSVEGDSASLSW